MIHPLSVVVFLADNLQITDVTSARQIQSKWHLGEKKKKKSVTPVVFYFHIIFPSMCCAGCFCCNSSMLSSQVGPQQSCVTEASPSVIAGTEP